MTARVKTKDNTWDKGLEAVYMAAIACEPRIGAKYRHFNGEVYVVQCLALNEEDTSVVVVFHKLGQNALLVRSLEEWNETVQQKIG